MSKQRTGYEGDSKFMVSRVSNYDPTRIVHVEGNRKLAMA